MRSAAEAAEEAEDEGVRRQFEEAVGRVSGWNGPAVKPNDVRKRLLTIYAWMCSLQITQPSRQTILHGRCIVLFVISNNAAATITLLSLQTAIKQAEQTCPRTTVYTRTKPAIHVTPQRRITRLSRVPSLTWPRYILLQRRRPMWLTVCTCPRCLSLPRPPPPPCRWLVFVLPVLLPNSNLLFTGCTSRRRLATATRSGLVFSTLPGAQNGTQACCFC